MAFGVFRFNDVKDSVRPEAYIGLRLYLANLLECLGASRKYMIKPLSLLVLETAKQTNTREPNKLTLQS